MSIIQGLRIKNPAHPSRFIKSEIIGALGLSTTEAASALGVTRAALSALVNQRAHLSPEMALRIEKAFGVSMDSLMRMQNSVAIAQARKREADINVAPTKASRSIRAQIRVQCALVLHHLHPAPIALGNAPPSATRPWRDTQPVPRTVLDPKSTHALGRG